MQQVNPLESMCKDCLTLLGADGYAEPHAHLRSTSSRRCSSMMGAAYEEYYQCTPCGQRWLHETGSCSTGWLASKPRA
jgi:hypothetical protein